MNRADSEGFVGGQRRCGESRRSYRTLRTHGILLDRVEPCIEVIPTKVMAVMTVTVLRFFGVATKG